MMVCCVCVCVCVCVNMAVATYVFNTDILYLNKI